MKQIVFLSLLLLNVVLGAFTPIIKEADYVVAGFAIIGIAAVEYWMLVTGMWMHIKANDLNRSAREMERRIKEMRTFTPAS